MILDQNSGRRWPNKGDWDFAAIACNYPQGPPWFHPCQIQATAQLLAGIRGELKPLLDEAINRENHLEIKADAGGVYTLGEAGYTARSFSGRLFRTNLFQNSVFNWLKIREIPHCMSPRTQSITYKCYRVIDG